MKKFIIKAGKTKEEIETVRYADTARGAKRAYTILSRYFDYVLVRINNERILNVR